MKSLRLMNCRPPAGKAYVPTDVEHLANMVTHALWIIPSFVAVFWMLNLATDLPQYLTSLVYGASLVVLFGTSTTFHIICYAGKCSTLRYILHLGDRAVIYIFIAASYTPWLALKELHGWGELALWCVWLAAMFGIWYQCYYHERYKWLEILFYLGIGIIPSLVVLVMHEPSGTYEMAIGGIIYILGVVFFKCDGIIPFAHAIWHCFVTVAAITHYLSVCTYLLGSNSATSLDHAFSVN